MFFYQSEREQGPIYILKESNARSAANQSARTIVAI